MQLPDQKYIATAAILFLTAFAFSFIGTSVLGGDGSKVLYSEDVEIKVNSSIGIVTGQVDGKNLSLMQQSTSKAKFFIDVTGDKNIDRKVEVKADGEIHRKKIFATLEGRTYTLTIQYFDNPEKSGDAYLKITKAEALK